MPFTLSLNEMTVAEKLRAMEAIWDDLCERGETIPSPAWHGDSPGFPRQFAKEGLNLLVRAIKSPQGPQSVEDGQYPRLW